MDSVKRTAWLPCDPLSSPPATTYIKCTWYVARHKWMYSTRSWHSVERSPRPIRARFSSQGQTREQDKDVLLYLMFASFFLSLVWFRQRFLFYTHNWCAWKIISTIVEWTNSRLLNSPPPPLSLSLSLSLSLCVCLYICMWTYVYE